MQQEGVVNRLERLCIAVRQALTDDLRRSPWRGHSNRMAGHCYVASEALWHLLGGPESGWTPQFVRHEGQPHWYLRRYAVIIDLTASQFVTAPAYHLGKGKGFLTKAPSRRAATVIQRVKRAMTAIDYIAGRRAS